MTYPAAAGLCRRGGLCYLLHMRATFRLLIALFLSLLLPLQAGSALAHSVAMGAAQRAAPVAAAATAPLQLAHAIGMPHQHHAHAHHEHRQVKKAPVGKPLAPHKSAHANSHCGHCGHCVSGTTCNVTCFATAAAPPPAMPVIFSPSAMRLAHLPRMAPMAAFIPDGPERPPRHLTA